MQKLRNIAAGFSIFILFNLLSPALLQAQNLDKSVLQDFIQTKQFVFKAETVLPMRGISRQLTSDYDVRFYGDSLIAYLPYFGRAYSAGYGEGGGIDFTSTKFDYKVKARKKGGWDLLIAPKDTRDVQQMDLTISDNGYATLQVTSNNRDPISFFGYVVGRKGR